MTLLSLRFFVLIMQPNVLFPALYLVLVLLMSLFGQYMFQPINCHLCCPEPSIHRACSSSTIPSLDLHIMSLLTPTLSTSQLKPNWMLFSQ